MGQSHLPLQPRPCYSTGEAPTSSSTSVAPVYVHPSPSPSFPSDTPSPAGSNGSRSPTHVTDLDWYNSYAYGTGGYMAEERYHSHHSSSNNTTVSYSSGYPIKEELPGGVASGAYM